MYLRSFSVENIRSISKASMEFDAGKEAGWHVILGSNGSGKSSLVRAFALLMMGEREAYAARQEFWRWMRNGETESAIKGKVSMDDFYDSLVRGGQPPKQLIAPSVTLKRSSGDPSSTNSPEMNFSGVGAQRTVWGGGQGWFSASFGPFRRFTGGDNKYDRLFVSNKRLAPHLTALGEDVALTDAMGWLATLFLQSLQAEKKGVTHPESLEILTAVREFLSKSNFLPHGAQISEVDGNSVWIIDGNEMLVALDQLSDGYRSVMSMVIELIRQMFEIYGAGAMLASMSRIPGTVQAPGVVVIDEVDAHLHPSWQRDIGRWLTKCFPKVQFIVTTHSPIVCRAVARDDGSIHGSIWRLPSPGSGEELCRVDDAELNLLAFGDVMDAYGTELFGSDVLRSRAGDCKLDRLATLNVQAFSAKLSPAEEEERRMLRRIFPASAGILGAEG